MIDQMPRLDRTPQLAELANWLAVGVREKRLDYRIARDALKRLMRVYDYYEPMTWSSVEAKALLDSGSAHSGVRRDHIYVITEDDFRCNDSVEKWLSDMKHLRLVVYVTASEHSRIDKWEKENEGSTGPVKYNELGIDVTGPTIPVRPDSRRLRETAPPG